MGPPGIENLTDIAQQSLAVARDRAITLGEGLSSITSRLRPVTTNVLSDRQKRVPVV